MLSNPRQMKKRHSLENRYYSRQLHLLKVNKSIYFIFKSLLLMASYNRRPVDLWTLTKPLRTRCTTMSQWSDQSKGCTPKITQTTRLESMLSWCPTGLHSSPYSLWVNYTLKKILWYFNNDNRECFSYLKLKTWRCTGKLYENQLVTLTVRDSAARLPNGEGTRGEICELLKDSQFLAPGVTDAQVTSSLMIVYLWLIHWLLFYCMLIPSFTKHLFPWT